jgi:ABC-type amino acid transport substrate-binding protein
MTTVGYGDLAPRTVGGRILGMIWMVTALLVVSFFTASITSALTVGQLSHRISNADDLAGAVIASVADTTSADWLERRGLDYANASDLRSALDELADGKVDAVLYDAPLLRWEISRSYRGVLQILPLVLERQDYAFALPDSSPLREALDASILHAINAPDWHARVSEYLGKR